MKNRMIHSAIHVILKEQDFGKTATEISRVHDISAATCHNCKNKHASLRWIKGQHKVTPLLFKHWKLVQP